MKAKEKLSVYGGKSLSELELLEVIVGATAPARALYDSLDAFSQLNSYTPHEMSSIPGIGDGTARRLSAAIELGKRLESARHAQDSADLVRRPSDAAQVLRGHLRGMQQECFVVIGINSRQKVVIVRTVAVGSLAQVDVHPRELFRPLVRQGVHSCVLAHNHPSGDGEPSEADVELTMRMSEVGRLVGIPVLDHVVITDSGSVSMAELGFMD